MKYILYGLLFLASFNLQAKGRQDYIKVSGFNSTYYEIENLEDFIHLVKENEAKKLFYNDTFFILPTTQAAYTLRRNGYDSIEDYKTAKKKGFRDANSYYYAKAHKLKTQRDVDTSRGWSGAAPAAAPAQQ